MKKLFLFVGLGLFCVINLFAQAPQTANQTDLPDIKFDKTTYDFGTIAYASNGTCEFTFKNTGVQPLIISDVHKTCGCTSVDWTKDPVKQGQSGIIKVTYDTKRVGPFTKTITVTSNAKTPTIPLIFKGTVESAPAQPPAPPAGEPKIQ
jgi:hypothetical protein